MKTTISEQLLAIRRVRPIVMHLGMKNGKPLWNMYESTPEGMDQFLCYLNQLIYSLERTPDLAMSITSPLMELVHSIGGDLEAEIEAELDREEFYQKIESI